MDDNGLIQGILFACERVFIHPPQGSTRAEIEALLAEDFRETGASGGTCGRADGIEALMQRTIAPLTGEWHIRDFFVRQIAEGCYLATYILIQPARTTRRATIWRLEGQLWRAVFHQGTIQGEPPCTLI